jgi:hypothetical protein
MVKVVFHEQLHKGLWEKIIEHGVAAHRMKLSKDRYGEPIYKDIPFESVFTLLDALTKAQEENLEMPDTAWAVLLSDGDVETARANPCKGLGWRVKRIYDELQELSRSLETIEGARAYDTEILQMPLTFKKLQDIIKFYRDDAKVFFDDLKNFITRKQARSSLWNNNWSAQVGWLFDIDNFQFMMTPSIQLLEIEVFKRRYLIGRQIIDFDLSEGLLQYYRTPVPDNYRLEMRLWLRNYWIGKVKQEFQVNQGEHSEDEDEDEDVITCERCGRCSDGRAQCPCGLDPNDYTDEGSDTDSDTDSDTGEGQEEQISEEAKKVKDSIKKVQTIIDAELNGNISDGVYMDLMNQLKLAFDSCH